MDFTTGIILLSCHTVTFLGALFLLCYLNRKWFYFREKNGVLYIMRGKVFPFGREIYIPDEKDLQRAFEPVLIPIHSEYRNMKFADKSEMEEFFFEMLFKWSKKLLYTDDPEQISSGLNYIERLQLLKLTVSEYRKLSSMRSLIVFKEGCNNMDKAYKTMLQARENFEECLSNDSKHFMTAEKNIAIISSAVDIFEQKTSVAKDVESGEIKSAFTPKIQVG